MDGKESNDPVDRMAIDCEIGVFNKLTTHLTFQADPSGFGATYKHWSIPYLIIVLLLESRKKIWVICGGMHVEQIGRVFNDTAG